MPPPNDVPAPSATSQPLDLIATGQAAPYQALKLVRKVDAGSSESAASIYEALRGITWKLLASRSYGPEMREWHDVFRQSSSLLEAHGQVGLGERVRVLADLALESARFGAKHSAESLLSKAHVRKILEFISLRQGEAKRNDIVIATGLRQANLSRILAAMAATGLIERQQEGKEVRLKLTRRAAEAVGGATHTLARAVHQPIESAQNIPSRNRRLLLAD